MCQNKLFSLSLSLSLLYVNKKIDKKIQTNAIYNIHNYIQNTKI